ncbi:hypothetical protein Hamer_G000694 [Homarus americanus]|uniref:Uncharacterized protein n=1 Tax=Homarus americanus TaxID=6706 RepID=A0A8J5TEI9_HOMAM|nr:hypothetical protein Hamer_G000694 [Homarus americanus]
MQVSIIDLELTLVSRNEVCIIEQQAVYKFENTRGKSYKKFLMKIFENLRGAILGDAAKQERHPIRTPIRPRELQSSVTAAGDNQLQNGNDIELTTNYNTMQEVPRPTAAVQDAEGGYVGPAAESREARGRPPSLSKYTTRGPQDGWCVEEEDQHLYQP